MCAKKKKKKKGLKQIKIKRKCNQSVTYKYGIIFLLNQMLYIKYKRIKDSLLYFTKIS